MQQERLYLRLADDPVYAPETTVPAGTVVHERVLPDGALRLIVDLQAGTATLAGPSVQPVLLAMRGHLRGWSVTLRPGASLALFGVPAHTLAGRVVDWRAVVGARHGDLVDRLQDSRNDAARARTLLSALQALARPVDPIELRRLDRATALLQAGETTQRIGDVAAAVDVGERRLQQIFRTQLGLSPRTWQRLARMHGCLQRLRHAARPRWSEVALEGGFFDQSHLVQEFRAFCGLTPGEYLQRHVSDSSKTPA